MFRKLFAAATVAVLAALIPAGQASAADDVVYIVNRAGNKCLDAAAQYNGANSTRSSSGTATRQARAETLKEGAMRLRERARHSAMAGVVFLFVTLFVPTSATAAPATPQVPAAAFKAAGRLSVDKAPRYRAHPHLRKRSARGR